MYPFRTDETFVRNAWYVGGVADEIDAGPFERIILGNPVVFFRAESGEARALHALCPHRAYPLALRGRVVGESIQCAYHGFTFDGRTGACVLVPSQDRPPSHYQQRVYPVCERGPWIWIWPGNPELADVSKVPTVDEVGFGPGWKYSEPVKFAGIKGRYMLLVENLFDLTHVGFLHGDMGDFDAIVQAPIDVEETDDRMKIVREMRTPWTNFHQAIFGSEHRFEGLSTYESVTSYYGPGYITTTGYITRSIEGLEMVDQSVYGHVHFHHAITPETPTSCHYFGTISRNHRLDDPYFDDEFRIFDNSVREQDVVAAEAIEDHMCQFGEPTVELMVKSDVAAGRARRRIQRQIDQEVASGRTQTEAAGLVAR